MNQTLAKGHCLCGAVKYKATGSPIWIAHCHCGTCRRNVGGTVATLSAFHTQQFFLTEGDFKVYESSPGVRRSFCGNCGTPMAYQADRRNEEIHLYLGTLEHPENYSAQFHVFHKDRLPWFDLSDDIHRFHELPEEG